jgi:hypothetical protein
VWSDQSEVSVDEFFMTEVTKLCDTHFPSLSLISIMFLHFGFVFKIDLHSISVFMLGIRFSMFVSILAEFLVQSIL